MAAIELSEAAATITGILVKPPGGVPGISPLGIPPPPGISPLGIVPPPGKVPPPPIPPICIGSVAKMLENPRDGGAWWAAIYGVAESDTTEAT